MIRMQAMLTVLGMTVLFCDVASGAHSFGGYGGGDLLAQTASYGRGAAAAVPYRSPRRPMRRWTKTGSLPIVWQNLERVS